MLHLMKAGWNISCIYMTDGRHGGNLAPEDIKKMRADEAKNERAFLDIVYFYDFDIEDGKLEQKGGAKKEEIVQKTAELIRDSDAVLIPSPAEAHPDHRATYELGHKAIESAKKPLEVHYVVWLFPFYQHTPGPVEKILKVDIDEHFKKKVQSIQCHTSQVEWGCYDAIIERMNSCFSLLYSTYRQRKETYAELVGIPHVNGKYSLFLAALPHAEDATTVFHGRKKEKIKA